jgi:hypothetical protein
MTDHKVVYQSGILFGMFHHVGARTYNRHIAYKDIDKLGYLVDIGLPNKIAYLGLAGIILGSLLDIGLFVIVHATELVYPELLSVESVSLLLENDRPSGAAFNEHSYNQVNERKQ